MHVYSRLESFSLVCSSAQGGKIHHDGHIQSQAGKLALPTSASATAGIRDGRWG